MRTLPWCGPTPWLTHVVKRSRAYQARRSRVVLAVSGSERQKDSGYDIIASLPELLTKGGQPYLRQETKRPAIMAGLVGRGGN